MIQNMTHEIAGNKIAEFHARAEAARRAGSRTRRVRTWRTRTPTAPSVHVAAGAQGKS